MSIATTEPRTVPKTPARSRIGAVLQLHTVAWPLLIAWPVGILLISFLISFTIYAIVGNEEGEGFTGLKPTGSVDPIIAAADHALADGKGDQLADNTAAAVREGMQKRFSDAYAKRQLAEQSVEQGREYVQAYVEFTHFVVALDHLVSSGASHKHVEAVVDVVQ